MSGFGQRFGDEGDVPQCFQNTFFYQFVHSFESILGVRENFHSILPLGIYTFFQKLVMINEFFQRKVGNRLFSAACWFFSFDNLFFSFFFFYLFPYLPPFFFLICSLFLFTFFSFLFHFLSFSIFIFIMIFLFILHIYFWTMFLNEELYTVPEFQTSLIVMI